MIYKLIVRSLCFILVGVVLIRSGYAANWSMTVQVLNINPNPEGSNLLDSFIIGENINADNGYDSLDIPKLQPYSPPYIWSYINHTTWGDFNGKYHRDLRYTDIQEQTWPIQVARQSPYSNNYRMVWEVPETFPPYYQLQLIRGTTVIDMLTDNEYSYTASSTVNLEIRTIPITGKPYIKEQIGEIVFSDNLERTFIMDDYFGIIASEIYFSVTADTVLVESITEEDDLSLWTLRPIRNWTGTTEATITATGDNGTAEMIVTITRDDTNSPPYYTDSDSLTVMTQNLNHYLELEGKIIDPDLDPIFVSTRSGEFVTAEYEQEFNRILLTPEPAFKGSDRFKLILEDGVNNPNEIDLEIIVLPSQPKPVENLQIVILEETEEILSSNSRVEKTNAVSQSNRSTNRSNHSLRIAWEEVTEDINNSPLTNLSYKIQFWNEAPILDPETAIEVVTEETYYQTDVETRLLFIRVIALNPEE